MLIQQEEFVLLKLKSKLKKMLSTFWLAAVANAKLSLFAINQVLRFHAYVRLFCSTFQVYLSLYFFRKLVLKLVFSSSFLKLPKCCFIATQFCIFGTQVFKHAIQSESLHQLVYEQQMWRCTCYVCVLGFQRIARVLKKIAIENLRHS